MTAYVLDASAGADLLLDTQVGRDLIERLEHGAQWWVPEHYFVEVASVLRRAELSGAISPATASSALRSLASAPLRRVQIRPLLHEAWAQRGQLTMYDALYVALAVHLDATLVTRDRRLARSPGLRVPVIAP